MGLAPKVFLGISFAIRAVGLSNLTALFEPYLSPEADIILPGDADWATKVQPRWSDYKPPTLIGVIKPMTESDIQHTVRVLWPLASILPNCGLTCFSQNRSR